MLKEESWRDRMDQNTATVYPYGINDKVGNETATNKEA